MRARIALGFQRWSLSKITQNYPKIIYTGQQLKTIINNY
jgi:hypothetical protein